MTMPLGSTEEPETVLRGHASIPVHVTSYGAKPGRQTAAEFGRFRTIIVGPTANDKSVTPGAQRLVSRSLRRKRVTIKVNQAVSNTPNSATTELPGPITDPGAGATIASLSAATLAAIAPGGTTWTVEWVAQLSGTITGADANNMSLVSNLQTKQVGIFEGVVGQTPQPSLEFVVPAGAGINVQAIAAASGAAAVYGAEITATPAPSPVTDGVIVGSREEICSGAPAIPGQLGGYIQIGDNWRWECQQELWVCYPTTNVNPVYVTVCDEQYASDPESFRSER